MRKSACDHEWIEDHDAAADAACYNDGFNYRPAEYICTKCKKTKKIKYADGARLGWYDPFSFLVMIIGILLAPIIMVIVAIGDKLLPKRKG
jgi:hypothetical protein